MVQRVHLIAAARPNFMKVAPLWHVLSKAPDFDPLLIHTGQHYDANMSDAFFVDLKLPQPHRHLGIGSGSHAEQTAGVMKAYEKVALEDRPNWLIVVGDVNSTAACALVAAKLRIPIVHLEAGLRSGDRDMPEEINRLVTDAISDVLWTPSSDADANLRAEGVPEERINRVGNIMLDSFELVRPAIENAAGAMDKSLVAGGYGVVTLHRPSNVDEPAKLHILAEALIAAHQQLPLVFTVHPRTAARLEATGLDKKLHKAGLLLLAPLSYVRFMGLVLNCGAVITDSGGLQEETTYLGIPCLTLRENTERPITITEGTNRLVSPLTLAAKLAEALATPKTQLRRPDRWDGKTAERCLDDLRRRSTLLAGPIAARSLASRSGARRHAAS